jgi:hypothetical protein
MAAIAASLARHGKPATVDLSWYAPNATSINNLNQVIGGSDIYGWVFNSSQVPGPEYGIYNWCNMPHVRKTEYKVPSSEYKLQYVELVGCAITIYWERLTATCRSIDITSERFTPRTPSLSNPMGGIAMMRNYFTTADQRLETSPP